MTTPVTTIDQRFSDPAAVAVSWDETRRVLEQAEMFWVTTVRADGRPHVTPLVAVWVDGAVHFHTGPGEQKAVNLRANPHVVLITGTNQWDSGVDVIVEGEAVRVTDEDTLKRLAEAWAAKWDGRWELTVGDGTFGSGASASHVYSVKPAKIFAHAKGDPFGMTRHAFG
jgi:nitroimidazol reductase NimA-like FMN-containing flavoprotein (pyridoxamine 5'-phosphate oxidase superfamily)